MALKDLERFNMPPHLMAMYLKEDGQFVPFGDIKADLIKTCRELAEEIISINIIHNQKLLWMKQGRLKALMEWGGITKEELE